MLQRSSLREREQLNVLQQTKDNSEKNLIEDKMTDVPKDEFLNAYAMQHLRANHSVLMAMNETDEEGL